MSPAARREFLLPFLLGILAGLERFAVLRTKFRQLNQNKAPVSAILGIKLHNGMGQRGGTGEEIKDKGILIVIVLDIDNLTCFPLPRIGLPFYEKAV